MTERGEAYKEVGVNLQSATTLVEKIKSMAADTYNNKGVLKDIGLFGGLYKLDLNDISQPVLVASTDGVGTKLNLAFQMNKHDTVGVDLVAMNVNDVVVHGAKPLFFMDYFASGKLDIEQGEQIVAGIVRGCKEAKCALLGGETAELPGFYNPGGYELSGFCIGIVDNAKIVDGSNIGVGNKLIGLASSGLHSNGYSLVRKLVAESGHDLYSPLQGTDQQLGNLLLEPTHIYVRSILNLLRDFSINGMVHITGGGFYDNLPRVLPKGVQAKIDFNSWTKPLLFEWLKEQGNLSWADMLQIFNCGVGMILVVNKRECEDILMRLQGLGEKAWIIGEVQSRKDKNEEQVDIVY